MNKTTTTTKAVGKARELLKAMVKTHLSYVFGKKEHDELSPIVEIATTARVSQVPRLVVRSPFGTTIDRIDGIGSNGLQNTVVKRLTKSDEVNVTPFAWKVPMEQPEVHGYDYETVSDASFLELEAYCSRPSDEFNIPVASSTINHGLNVDHTIMSQPSPIKSTQTIYSQQSTALAGGSSGAVGQTKISEYSDSGVSASSPLSDTKQIQSISSPFRAMKIDDDAKTREQPSMVIPKLHSRDKFNDTLEYMDYILAHAERAGYGKFEEDLSQSRKNALGQCFRITSD